VAGRLADLTVTGGSAVRPRSSVHDIMVEIPTSLPSCGYSPCGSKLGQVPVQVTNTHATEARVLRLALSRNFNMGPEGAGVVGRRPGAEITGMNVLLLDEALRPTGIPVQISKNWHDDSSAKFAGYHGYWWTANVVLHMPADSTISLTFATVYELYGGVPAWSHAQLSLVGYSDMWLWEEAALGCSGENIVFDPLGMHTRASITDVRPKLFHGEWTDNVGGGEMFPTYFGADGAFQYWKAMDAQIHTSGPCLSNSSYVAISEDEALETHVTIAGGRTDDLPRTFFHVRLRALKATTFSRLVFFQIGSEGYNYNVGYQNFHIGHNATVDHTVPRTCSGGTSKRREKMYVGGPQGQTLAGPGPWWFAMTGNTDRPDDGNFRLGDRGFVVRSYKARLGGQSQAAPTFSINCDKLELVPPTDVDTLSAGDELEMQLELITLPLEVDYDAAKTRSGSATLALLAPLSSYERVRMHATSALTVEPLSPQARPESHYPIRVCDDSNSGEVLFRVDGTALGYTPVVICGLTSAEVSAERGLWIKQTGDAGDYTRVVQKVLTEDDYYQVNYDRKSGLYDIVFNIELHTSGTLVAFGVHPDVWTTTTAASPIFVSGSWPTSNVFACGFGIIFTLFASLC